MNTGRYFIRLCGLLAVFACSACSSTGNPSFGDMDGSTEGSPKDGAVDGATDGGHLLNDAPLTRPSFVFRVGADSAQQYTPEVGDRFIRGIWDHVYVDDAEATGRADITSHLDQLQAAGINAVALWTVSRHLDAVRDPETFGATWPSASWDPIGVYVTEAHARGMEAYLWFSPFNYKDTWRATELETHPEWQAVLTSSYACVDISDPDALNYEVELIRFMAEHYHPDAIQLEEPYFIQRVLQGGPFAAAFEAKFGYSVAVAAPTREADALALQEEVLAEFVSKARAAMFEVDPSILLQANGPADASTRSGGFAIDDWSRNRWIDAIVPQVYTTNLGTYNDFRNDNLTRYATTLGVYAGTAIQWSALMGAANPVVIDQVTGNEALGGTVVVAGSLLFSWLSFEALGTGSMLSASTERATVTLGTVATADSSDPTWVAGDAGSGALRFDGVDDLASIPAAQALNVFGHVAIRMKLRMDGPAAAPWATLLQRGDQSATKGFFWLYVTPANEVVFQLADGTKYQAPISAPMPTLTDGEWHTLEVDQDRRHKEVRFYLDGALISVADYPDASIPAAYGTTWIGTYGGVVSPEYMWKGDLASVEISRHLPQD
jgi:hypothetical protein